MRFPQPPYSEDLIQSTLKQWGPLYKEKECKELTRPDAKEILINLFGFFNVLVEIDEERKIKERGMKAHDEGRKAFRELNSKQRRSSLGAMTKHLKDAHRVNTELKRKYGAKIYVLEDGSWRVVQVVKTEAGHNDKYHEDVDENDRYRQRFITTTSDSERNGELARAVRSALRGRLTHQVEPGGRQDA